MKTLTKKLQEEIFVWDANAFGGKGYWFVLGKNGGYGKAASKKEADILGKPEIPKETATQETASIRPVSNNIKEIPVKETLEQAPVTNIIKEVNNTETIIREVSSYNEAAQVRKTKLSDLIAKKIIEGGNIGSSIKSSISEKSRARLTGIKEVFDPLNIAKKLTGNLGIAMLGRATGRKQEDIEHFTGNKALYTKVAEGQKQKVLKGDSVANVFGKLYNLMKQYHEEDVTRMELERSAKKFREEEEQTWHEEIIAALMGKGTKQKKQTANKEENKSWFDKIKELFQEWQSLKDVFNILKKIGSNVWKGIVTIGEALLAPATLWLLTIGASTVMAYFLGTKLKNAIEESQAKQAEKLGGPEAVKALQEEQNSRNALNESGMPNEDESAAVDRKEAAIQKKQDAIGTYMLQKGYDRYNVKNLWGGKTFDYVYRKGGPNGQLAPQSLVDEAEKYVSENRQFPAPVSTATKMELPKEVAPSTAGAGRGSSESASTDVRRVDIPRETAIPTAPAANPLGERVQGVISKNNDMRMEQNIAAKTTVIDNSKNITAAGGGSTTEDITTSAIPVRNDEDTWMKLQRLNYRAV